MHDVLHHYSETHRLLRNAREPAAYSHMPYHGCLLHDALRPPDDAVQLPDDDLLPACGFQCFYSSAALTCLTSSLPSTGFSALVCIVIMFFVNEFSRCKAEPIILRCDIKSF